uniref:Uncharacterized protein n=1 Tax=Plectus sambesii TaxID=2011161 RepID=A0A914XLR4_9BILA
MHRLWVAVSLLYAVYAQHDQASNVCRSVEDAVKPDRTDCTRYIYCWQSRMYLFKCHSGFTYDQCQQRCVKIVQPCEYKSICQCSLNPECVVQKAEVRLNDEKPPPDIASDTTVAADQLDSSVESSSPFASTPSSDEAVSVGGGPTTTAAGYLVKVLFSRDKSELSGGYAVGSSDKNNNQSLIASGGVTVMGEDASSVSGTDVTDSVTVVDTSGAAEGGTTEATSAETGNESGDETSVTGVSGSQTDTTAEGASESTGEPSVESSSPGSVEETTGETTGVSDGAVSDGASLETSSPGPEDTSGATTGVSGETAGEAAEVESSTSAADGEIGSSPESAPEGSTESPLESSSLGSVEGEVLGETTATQLFEESSSITDASSVDGIEEGTGSTGSAVENLVEGTSVATPEESSDGPESSDQTTISSSESSVSAGEETSGLTLAPGETTGGAATGGTLESSAVTGDTTIASAIDETNESEEPDAGKQYIEGQSSSPDELTTVTSAVDDDSAPSSESVPEEQATGDGEGVSDSGVTLTPGTTEFPIETASTDFPIETASTEEPIGVTLPADATGFPVETVSSDEASEVTESFVTESAGTVEGDQGVESFEPVTEQATTELSNDSGPRVTPQESQDDNDVTASRLFEQGSPSSPPKITGGPLDAEEQSTIIEAAQSQQTDLPKSTGCACDSGGATSVGNVRAYCAQLICRNGGKYFTISSGHCGCVCSSPYRGAECEHLTDVSQCRCANGGKCMPMRVAGSGIDAFSCECPLGFLGSQCQYSVAEIIVNDSSANAAPATTIDLTRYALCDRQDLCSNGGLCLLDVVSKNQRCYCPPGFGGPTCGTAL